MTFGDLIYCYPCKKISIDNNKLKLQDSRFNENWNYRCPFCYGFKTVNASQFLRSANNFSFIPVEKNKDRGILAQRKRLLKKENTGCNYWIRKQRGGYILFEVRKPKKFIAKAIRNFLGDTTLRKPLNSIRNTFINGGQANA